MGILIALKVCLILFASAPTRADPSRTFTYEDLVALIQNKKITSIEELLPLLPTELRSSYVLLRQSRSQQSASADHPRVVLFGIDGSLTCAFNGDPGQKGYDSLECFQFRRSERRFDFRQIEFPSVANGLSSVMFSESKRAVLKNVSCSACHGDDPRPNWDGWQNWVGAYGAQNGLGYEERYEYFSFVNGRQKNPRYKWLVQEQGSYAPFGTTTVEIRGEIDRPNLRLSDLVGRMNAFRAARLLETRVPFWQTLLFAVQGLGCELSSAQKARIAKEGLPLISTPNISKKESNPELESIFGQLQIKPNDWSTQIFRDPPEFHYPEYEHQSGHGYLTIDVAMAILTQLAENGNTALAEGIRRLRNSLDSLDVAPVNIPYIRVLHDILPDTEYQSYYETSDRTRLDYICPEATRLFVDSRGLISKLCG
jgi:hypothetical protein